MDGAGTAVAHDQRSQLNLPWPRFLGPRPGLKEIHLAAWLCFLAFQVAPTCVGFWIFSRAPGSLPDVASGFAYFYGDGDILKTHPAHDLYNYSVQIDTFHRVWPKKGAAFGPSPYPPFVALFFSLFARLSLRPAYFLWLALSLVLYLTGILATARLVLPGERLKASLLVCLSIAFYPFFHSNLLNGRLASIEVFSIGLAILFEERKKPIRSGLALSLLAYKPTLALLIVPMLLITRRFKAFLGFLSGSVILAAIATAFAGPSIWSAYLHFTLWFSKLAGPSGQLSVVHSRYVDLDAFFHSLPGVPAAVGSMSFSTLVVIVGMILIVLLWRSAHGPRPVQYLAWSVTLTWTLLLNVYVPLYDSILVVLSLALTFAALHDLQWRSALRNYALLSALIFASSFVTDSFEQKTGIPILTIALAMLGVMQLVSLARSLSHTSANMPRNPAVG